MDPPLQPDIEVIARVLEGNVDDFCILVERYQRQVYELGRRFHRHTEDVEDFVQEVFLRAYNRLAQFRAEGRLYSWLMRIAYRQGINRVGRRSIEFVPECNEPVDTTANPEQLALRLIACQELRTEVSRLPCIAAACIDLFFFFELTYQEVAETTGLPVNTVKSHVYRAKLRLRNRLVGSVAEVFDEL